MGGKGKTKLAEQSRISSTTKRKLPRLLILRSLVFFPGLGPDRSVDRNKKREFVSSSRRKEIPYHVDTRTHIFSKLSPRRN